MPQTDEQWVKTEPFISPPDRGSHCCWSGAVGEWHMFTLHHSGGIEKSPPAIYRMDTNHGFFADTIDVFIRYNTHWTQIWIT